MKQNHEVLFTPFTINKTVIKNRICMAPLYPSGWLDEKACFTDKAVRYYEERARGGVGLIFTGETNADWTIEGVRNAPDCYRDEAHYLATTRRLIEACHKYDCKVFLQIQLGYGRVSDTGAQECTPLAPSPAEHFFDPQMKCEEMPREKIYQLIEAVVRAAGLIKEAGADGININGIKGGYLGDQFAMECFNRREDEFGGDLAGRLRLMTLIAEGIRSECGPDFPLTTRIGTRTHMKAPGAGALPGESYTEYGRDMEESLAAARILQDAGYDAVVFGTGCYDAMYWLYPPMYMEDGCYLEEAAALQETLEIPVICPGKLSDPDLAAQAVQNGSITALAMGRGLLADPFWAEKVRCGEPEKIRPCLYCNNGCLSTVMADTPLRCAVNPDLFREGDPEDTVAPRQKVAVVGGGIAGMAAARTAAQQGAEVTLYEQTEQLGGLLLAAEVPDFKQRDRILLKWMKAELEGLGVAVSLGHRICTKETLPPELADVDTVFFATGSKPRRLPIPGADQPFVMTGEDALLGRRKIGRRVVVIGGGLVGCEIAYWLKTNGKDVTILEMMESLLPETAGQSVPTPNRQMMLGLLQQEGVASICSAMVKEIRETGDVILRISGSEETTISADAIIVCAGYQSERTLYDALREPLQQAGKTVHLIGDAEHPATIMKAIADGTWAAQLM